MCKWYLQIPICPFETTGNSTVCRTACSASKISKLLITDGLWKESNSHWWIHITKEQWCRKLDDVIMSMTHPSLRIPEPDCDNAAVHMGLHAAPFNGIWYGGRKLALNVCHQQTCSAHSIIANKHDFDTGVGHLKSTRYARNYIKMVSNPYQIGDG